MSGWPPYLDFGDALSEALGDSIGENACEMEVPSPPQLMGTLREWGDSRLENEPLLLLRAVGKACLVQQHEPPEANLRDYRYRRIHPIVS